MKNKLKLTIGLSLLILIFAAACQNPWVPNLLPSGRNPSVQEPPSDQPPDTPPEPPPPAYEHTWSEWVETMAATCTTPDMERRECTREGCEGYETRTGATALGHDWGEWKEVTPATYAAAGLETRICKVCGDTDTQSIPRRTLRMVPIPNTGYPDFLSIEPTINPALFTFTRGDDDDQSWNAQPPHLVTLTQGFYMGIHEVTQRQFEDIMGYNHSGSLGRNLPVESVTWHEAIVFSNRLSIKNDLSPAYKIRCAANDKWTADPDLWGDVPTLESDYGTLDRWNAVKMVPGSTGYRLPTEAEWEFACRAGTTTPWNTGTSITAGWPGQTGAQANFGGVIGTTPVGSYAPNAWGLHDMHGNVNEWVWDWFGSYTVGPYNDPLGVLLGTFRVIRGGCWDNPAQNSRSAYRVSHIPPVFWFSNVGFRVVRP